MDSFVALSEKREHLFFSDTDFVRDFIAVGRSPGRHYYSMVKEVHSLHTERAELYYGNSEVRLQDKKLVKFAHSMRRVVGEGQ